MDSTILAGALGAAATLVAAIIGAIALYRTQKPKVGTISEPSSDPHLPYSVHRKEMERREREARELLKAAIHYRERAKLAGEELARAKRYWDNLADYFEDVSNESPLELEVGVKPDGMTAVFCNKPLRTDLKRIDLFLEEKGMIFVAESGSRRPIGLPLTDEVIAPLAKHRPEKVLFVEVNPLTGEPLKGFYVPLRIYDPHRGSNQLTNSSGTEA